MSDVTVTPEPQVGGLSAVPSLARAPRVAVVTTPGEVDAVAHLVPAGGPLPASLDVSWDDLAAAGFTAEVGTTIVLPRRGAAPVVLVGLGKDEDPTLDSLRDAAATAVRACASWAGRIALVPGDLSPSAAALAAVLTEGAALGRYRFTTFQTTPKDRVLTDLELVVPGTDGEDDASIELREALDAGVTAGLLGARAAGVARDLANTPPGHLTATDMAEVAMELGETYGFEVDVLDRAQLLAMGCGGILGVNAGSVEEPRLVVLRYVPDAAAGGPVRHLGLVGKGIMYDSGGISLKPSDPMHLLMKMDMGGAAAVLGAFTALRDSGVDSAVTGWLACTDNMPSGSAYKLGDVLTARGGRTVEVKNTDAEGRLVMMDALALAVEAEVDAIVDIATLTGASLMALGKSTAALFGNDDVVVGQVLSAGRAVDEPVWRLPLEKKYRKQLDSAIADIANLGSPHAGATTAALFLAEFVGETPWAHVDIAGTMQVDTDEGWRSAGATGFGARLLAEVARQFVREAGPVSEA